MGEADSGGDSTESFVESRRDLPSRPDHRDGFKDVITDQVRHFVPAVLLGHAVEFEMQISPTMGIESQTVGGGRSVKGQLFSSGLPDANEFFFFIRSDDQSGANDLELVQRTPASFQALFKGWDHHFFHRESTLEGVRDEAIGRFTGHLRHEWAEAAREDGRRTEGVRAWVEGGDHQGVTVELTLEVEFGRAFPTREDGFDGLDDLAHPGRRFRPLHAESVLDMGSNLRAQPEKKATSADVLHSVSEVGQVHRVSRERNGDGGAQSQMARVF